MDIGKIDRSAEPERQRSRMPVSSVAMIERQRVHKRCLSLRFECQNACRALAEALQLKRDTLQVLWRMWRECDSLQHLAPDNAQAAALLRQTRQALMTENMDLNADFPGNEGLLKTSF
eukprot:scaffold1638_cov258-Pinguiococcus_pyrenoidosus.AAC.85